MRLFLWMILFVPFSLPAATLPKAMNRYEVGGIVSKMGFGGATRLMRSTEAYESFPGIKMGFELGFIPTEELNSYGDLSGSIPSVTPTPRFYLAKGLFADTELIITFFFPGIMDALSSAGGILKWNFHKEEDSWFSSAVYAGYTRVTAFKGNYTGDDFEAGIYASKDYVRVKPYAGASLLFAHGTVPTENAPLANTAWEATSRLFLGLEVEFLANLTFQAELIRMSPAASILVAAKF